jgi:hypothetical protein
MKSGDFMGGIMLGSKLAEEVQACVDEARKLNDMDAKIEALGNALSAIASAMRVEDDLLKKSAIG